MKLRTFTAPDMPSAMKMIREELGEDAVILATHPERGRKAIRVTAAVENMRERSTFHDIRDTVDFARKRNSKLEWQQQMAAIFEFHRTPASLVELLKSAAEAIELDSLLMLQKLAAEQSKTIVQGKALALVLDRHFTFSPLPLAEAGKKLMFIGPSGAGKTLTVAKLATQLVMAKKPVSVITIDHKRAGGVEQLAAYTDILELPLSVAEDKEELHQAIRAIPMNHITLIDTFGCNAFDRGERAAINSFTTTSVVEPVLVLPAGLDSCESVEIANALTAPGLKRLLITRLDTARRYGNLLAAADQAGLAFCNVTMSPKVVGECAALSASRMAEFLLQYRSTSNIRD